MEESLKAAFRECAVCSSSGGCIQLADAYQCLHKDKFQQGFSLICPAPPKMDGEICFFLCLFVSIVTLKCSLMNIFDYMLTKLSSMCSDRALAYHKCVKTHPQINKSRAHGTVCNHFDGIWFQSRAALRFKYSMSGISKMTTCRPGQELALCCICLPPFFVLLSCCLATINQVSVPERRNNFSRSWLELNKKGVLQCWASSGD